MTFASEPLETDLEDSLSCTHLVCCRLNMGSLFHRDDRDIVDEEEYMPDPYTGKREVSCASCGHYLLNFLLKAMEQTKWLPKTCRVLCTGCSRDLKLACGKCTMRSKCGSCLQKVSVSLAEICTYLTAIYGMETTEGENEDPITLKSGDLDLINWMQRMFRDSMLLWASNPLTSEQVSGTPKLSFSEALLKVSLEHREEMKILDLRIPTHLLLKHRLK